MNTLRFLFRDDAYHLWIIVVAILVLIPLYYYEKSNRTPLAVGHIEPTFAPPPGRYREDIHVNLLSSSQEARIIFTLDGETPHFENGRTYTQPIHLSSRQPITRVLRARTLTPDGTLGPVAEAVYVMEGRP